MNYVAFVIKIDRTRKGRKSNRPKELGKNFFKNSKTAENQKKQRNNNNTFDYNTL